MKEIIIEVPDDFGKTLKPEKVNSEIKGEIVRCKDCRHCTFSDSELADCMIKQGWFPVKPDWFCADGERKTE